MKYLKEFATQADYEAAVAAGLAKPNVSLINEPFGVQYKKYVPLGVFIQHIDGTLYKTEEWTSRGFANDDANGVVVITDSVASVVAKNRGNHMWTPSSASFEIPGVFVAKTEEEAISDFNGENNTIKMLNWSSTAAQYANNFVFPNGAKGHLGSAGEWNAIMSYYDAVIEAQRIIEAQLLSESPIWTSTQKDGSNAWYVDGNGLFSTTKGMQWTVFPLSHLEL